MKAIGKAEDTAMTLMCKLDRIFTWVLGVSFVALVFTGLDVQQRLLIPQLSSLLHLKWFVLPALVSFGFHTVFRASRRIRQGERFYMLKWILLGIFTGFIAWMAGFFIYYQWIA
jgi:hypothetical protein